MARTTKASQAKTQKAKPRRAAKAAKKLKTKGTVDDVLTALWTAIDKVSVAVDDLNPESYVTEDKENSGYYISDLCKLTHTLSQAGSTYSKLIETGELQARLEALELIEQARKAA